MTCQDGGGFSLTAMAFNMVLLTTTLADGSIAYAHYATG